jgi:hypothetical protein
MMLGQFWLSMRTSFVAVTKPRRHTTRQTGPQNRSPPHNVPPLIDCLEHVGFRNLLQGGAGRLPCPAYRHRAICLTYPTSALLVRDRKVP